MKTFLYAIAVGSLAIFVNSCTTIDQNKENRGTVAILVKVASVKASEQAGIIAVSGKVQATNSADLSTRLMGYISKFNVNVGDHVRKGQVLVSINATDLKAKRGQIDAGIKEATVAYSNAEKDYVRFKTLYEQQSVSQKEMDDMSGQYKMAKARLDAAEQSKHEINAQFNYAHVKAPFDGVITSKTIDVGDMASPGVPLISLENSNKFEVIVMIPEFQISQIEKGSKVQVNLKALDKMIAGQVVEMSPSSKHTGGQYMVKVALDTSNEKLLSGMFVTVQFPVLGASSASSTKVLIPRSSIVRRGQLSGVYTVSQGGTALLRWVRLGRTYGHDVEVVSGLNTNEMYIISTEEQLYNGANVRIQ